MSKNGTSINPYGRQLLDALFSINVMKEIHILNNKLYGGDFFLVVPVYDFGTVD